MDWKVIRPNATNNQLGYIFTYDKLNRLTSAGYDQNGNLTMDLNREICSIAYNCLNLPQRVDFQDGSYVLYTYNAGGHKLRTDYYINPLPNMVPQVNGGTGMNRNANLQHTRVDYCGNLVYENDTLKQALFDGGHPTHIK